MSGANSWKKHHPRMMAGFQRIFIFGDGDKAGMDFSKAVNDSLSNGIRIMMPAGQDVNDFYLKSGVDGIVSLLEEN